MKKILFAAIITTMMTACSERTFWRQESGVCVTPEEKKAAGELTRTFLGATPQFLAGDDQDWEDAIYAAGREARDTACSTILVEMHEDGGIGPTVPRPPPGRWKYTGQYSLVGTKQ